jgi:hypothetical protein
MTHDPHGPHRAQPQRNLDALLRDWRRRQDATAHPDALATRVVTAMRRDSAALAPPPGPPPRRRWAERTAWFAAGIAAAVAVVLVLRSPARDEAADWPPTVRFAAGQVAEKATLVAGMEDTFGAGLVWIAEHDRRVEVGLVPGALPPVGGGGVAVRIVVLARRDGEAAWRSVWQSDVLARDEQVVDVAAGPEGTGRLRLWTHPLPDGAIAVDGELALTDAPLALRASYGGVQRPGEPRRVTSHRADGVEWQVIQTVVPLASAREDVG